MSAPRTVCHLPPVMRATTLRQTQINAYIRREVESGRGIPSKRKVTLLFGKPGHNELRALRDGLARRGLIGPAREQQL